MTNITSKTRLISLNVNGLRSPTKRKAIFKTLHNSNADIIFLQETHSILSDQKIWSSEWGGTVIYAHGLSNSRGVAILFKRAFNPQIISKVTDQEGRFLLIQIQRNSEIMALINIYAPTQSEPRLQLAFMDLLDSTTADLDAHNIFMGGDFNAHMDDKPSGPNPNKQIYLDRINSLTSALNLSDSWKQRNPNSHKGTFHRGQYSARLDYWFLSSHLLPSVSSFEVDPHPLSDHSMLTIDIGLEK